MAVQVGKAMVVHVGESMALEQETKARSVQLRDVHESVGQHEQKLAAVQLGSIHELVEQPDYELAAVQLVDIHDSVGQREQRLAPVHQSNTHESVGQYDQELASALSGRTWIGVRPRCNLENPAWEREDARSDFVHGPAEYFLVDLVSQ
jgi:hypothetical protein